MNKTIILNQLSSYALERVAEAKTKFSLSEIKKAALDTPVICTQNPGHIDLRSRLTHGCFPVLNRRHPFCFSLDPLVIVVVYVFLYCSLELIE